MFPVWHAYVANQVGLRSPSAIFGSTVPDINVVSDGLLYFGDTHDKDFLEKALPRLTDRDLAAGWATHAFVLDGISHGFTSETGPYSPEVYWKDGYSFRWLAKNFPKVKRHSKFLHFLGHNVAEYALELWLIKNKPEALAVAKRMYEIDVRAAAADIAYIFRTGKAETETIVRRWLSYNRMLSVVSRALAPFAADTPGKERQACLEKCIEGCKSLSE